MTRLAEYSRDAATGICEGMFETAPHAAPPTDVTSSPATEPSTLPPVSAARSTTTDPGPMVSTIWRVTSSGAGRPGTAAVVISASAAAM